MSVIIVFSRSNEANGINEVKRILSLHQGFKVIDNAFDLFKLFMFRRRFIKSVLCLSSTDLVICLALQNITLNKLKIVMAVYHPKQWQVMLDKDYSSRRAAVFLKYLKSSSLDNIIFNTEEAYNKSMELFRMEGVPNLIVAPCHAPSINKSSFLLEKTEGVHYVATVGRLVDFKIQSVYRMIEAISSLNAIEGIRIEYHVFGNGPCERQLEERISSLPDPSSVKFHGYLDPDSFGATISQFDSYFGMGFTVVHSSMIAVPSIIAVQDENKDICYGLFHKYDHFKNPMFGDQSDKAILSNIRSEMKRLATLNKEELNDIGKLCKVATKAYEIDIVLKGINSVCVRAPHTICYVSLFDLIVIRIQSFLAKFRGVKFTHT